MLALDKSLLYKTVRYVEGASATVDVSESEFNVVSIPVFQIHILKLYFFQRSEHYDSYTPNHCFFPNNLYATIISS